MRSSRHFKTISLNLILVMLHLCWITSYSYAEMVPTGSATQSQVQDDRQRLLDLLHRQEVVNELEKYGISKVEAATRINSLTGEEVTKIAGKLDELPTEEKRALLKNPEAEVIMSGDVRVLLMGEFWWLS